MQDTKLYQQTGIDTLENLIKIFGKPTWYWYEPKPESLIGTGTEPPLQTLQKGSLNIPEGVECSEILLFYPKGSLTLVAQGNKQYRYFYCGQDETKGELVKGDTHKNKLKAYLRTVKNLLKQYGISSSDGTLHPEKDGDKPIKLIEYYHHDQRIAWTIKE